MSPALRGLQADDSPLASGPVTVEDASWMGGVMCIGGVLGCIVFGSILTKIGRKRSLMVVAVPQLVNWLLKLFGDHVYHLMVARFLVGFSSGGIYICIPVIVAEIADSR